MHYSTAIFDLDGTLLNTLQDLAFATNQVLAEKGYVQHPESSYRFFVGDGLRTLMSRATPDNVSEDDIDSCCALFEEIYSTCWAERTRPYQGIVEMLAALNNRGIRLAILSNKPHQFTVACVKHFFPTFSFDPVFGVRDGIPKKPDPAGAREILSLHNVSPENCMYIGDTSVDMQTGKSAGMFTIGVSWGFRPRSELIEYNADLIVDTPEEIVNHAVTK